MHKHKRSFDPAFTRSQPISGDLDEVSFLSVYSDNSDIFDLPEALTAPAKPFRRQPLVDVITPQPKAFFAYMRMPETKKTVKQPRVKRVRKSSKGTK